ncbi:hypothetical protein FOCG_11896 [Fusarium oxysporum f. sp. radicis-lycopersici 26381]|nr:hypothetical protein FOCG_11896 [Fusarium oxysporum f. sp. radicis-lycopersici 26381]
MTKGTDIANCVFTGLGLITIFVALLTFCRSVRRERSAQDVGFICSDGRRMGIFQAKAPWYLSGGSRAKVPPVPSITGLLRAAEADVWTSALVDNLYENLDDEVCWKNIYEAFFIHLAWENQPAPKIGLVGTIMSRASRLTRRLRYQVAYDLYNFDIETRQGKVVGSLLRILSCVSWALLHIFPDILPYIRKSSTLYHACHDRRLLYEKLLPKSRPLLRKGIKPLEKLNTEDDLNPLTGKRSIWKRNLHPIWILDKRPCVAVFRDQLEAFCLVFAINLTKNRGSFHGAGAFGLTINISPINNILKVELLQTRRKAPLDPAKGSGYSLLYAKLMGCGCIPFARTPSWVKSILVTADILIAIKEGHNIRDADELSHYAGAEYLQRLPGQYNHDLFFMPGSRRDQPYGGIYDKFGQALHASNSTACTWPMAVAGIAFGGFVPQATLYLVEAVRFTLFGTLTLDRARSEEFLDKIERFIHSVDSWEPEAEIFGTWVARRREVKRDHAQALIITTPIGIADAAAIFSRYTTLLERLLALVNRTHDSNDPVKETYTVLCARITSLYTMAVDVPQGFNTAESQICEDLDSCLALQHDSIDVEWCSRVAIILIVAWTYAVNLVQWDGEHNCLFISHAEHNGENPAKLLKLDAASDMPGAWGL